MKCMEWEKTSINLKKMEDFDVIMFDDDDNA